MFGLTALEWRDAHPDLKGNVRDYATVNELICLSNMENLNAVFIGEGLPQHERLGPAEPDSYPADADTGRCKQEIPQVAAFTRMNR